MKNHKKLFVVLFCISFYNSMSCNEPSVVHSSRRRVATRLLLGAGAGVGSWYADATEKPYLTIGNFCLALHLGHVFIP